VGTMSPARCHVHGKDNGVLGDVLFIGRNSSQNLILLILTINCRSRSVHNTRLRRDTQLAITKWVSDQRICWRQQVSLCFGS
jgi:hypothetical protein